MTSAIYGRGSRDLGRDFVTLWAALLTEEMSSKVLIFSSKIIRPLTARVNMHFFCPGQFRIFDPRPVWSMIFYWNVLKWLYRSIWPMAPPVRSLSLATVYHLSIPSWKPFNLIGFKLPWLSVGVCRHWSCQSMIYMATNWSATKRIAKSLFPSSFPWNSTTSNISNKSLSI